MKVRGSALDIAETYYVALIFASTLWSSYFCTHFTTEENENYRPYVPKVTQPESGSARI